MATHLRGWGPSTSFAGLFPICKFLLMSNPKHSSHCFSPLPFCMKMETVWAQTPFPGSKAIPSSPAPWLRMPPFPPLLQVWLALLTHRGVVPPNKWGWPHQSHRGCQSLNLMCSYQGQKPCWARVLPKMRWGFPPKNPYRPMERWPKRQAQKWGSRSPDIP